ncbi:ferredoxin reductase-like protein [Neurospora tetraspora]|uniref:NADH-cytochrome b5 reductase n=1 Tax=Neurospora tetraspora TaxID=94610 RepID=A0AAE0J8L3_9PEZI|nr:ferredoxin reductase-like protein [Neurospora tetraspora]
MPPYNPFKINPNFLHPTLKASVMSTQVAVAAGVAGLGIYAFYLRRNASGSATGAALATNMDASDLKPGKLPLSGFGFHSLRLHSTELINHNTKKLRFELPDPSQPSGMGLTSALLTISFPKGRWLPVLRPYTPTNDLNEPGFVELMVKLYPGGKQSTHLHSLQPGDTLTVAPIPELKWTPNKHPHVAMIAGGAGITPMYQLVRGILTNPADSTRITLVWGVNTDEDIFLRDQLAELEQNYPGRLKTVYVVAQPSAQSPYQKGFVTRQVLEQAGISAAAEKSKGTKVLLCGPPAMEKALKGTKGWVGGGKKGVLQELGYTLDQIYSF